MLKELLLIHSFNSRKVQLRLFVWVFWGSDILCFNSRKVQLRFTAILSVEQTKKFQFQKGTIEILNSGTLSSPLYWFQFQKGTIEITGASITRASDSGFQFQKGTIEILNCWVMKTAFAKFQFQKGTIEISL